MSLLYLNFRQMTQVFNITWWSCGFIHSNKENVEFLWPIILKIHWVDYHDFCCHWNNKAPKWVHSIYSNSRGPTKQALEGGGYLVSSEGWAALRPRGVPLVLYILWWLQIPNGTLTNLKAEKKSGTFSNAFANSQILNTLQVLHVFS